MFFDEVKVYFDLLKTRVERPAPWPRMAIGASAQSQHYEERKPGTGGKPPSLRRYADAIEERLVSEASSKFSKISKIDKFKILQIVCKVLAGSFSAVSKRNCARKYAFDSIFKLYTSCIFLHPCNLNFF